MKSLVSAILLLAKEVKRFNDAHEPAKTRPKAEAEYFSAKYEPEKEREVREALTAWNTERVAVEPAPRRKAKA